MKLVNTSRYTTASLKAFLLAGFRGEGVDPAGYHVVCATSRSCYGWPNGRAWQSLRKVYLSIPLQEKLDIPALAAVFAHELGHCRGLDHREMPRWTDLETPWAANLTLAAKPPERKPRRDLVNERHIKARLKLTEWERKLKRAQGRVRLYRKRVRYYELKTAERFAARTRP